MGNVGNGDAFPGLLVMQTGSKLQRNIKSPCQEGDVCFHVVILRLLGPRSLSRRGPAFWDCGIHVLAFILTRAFLL